MIWKPVVGYAGWYEVSDHGHVRSVDRYTANNRLRLGKVLTPIPTKYGYLVVNLNRNRTVKQKFIHVLVLEAFVGPKPEGTVCCHGPGGQKDNSVWNLSYNTQAFNLGPDRNRDQSYTSPQTGVHWNQWKQKWEVKVKSKYIGTYQCHDEAVATARALYGY